MSASFCLFSRLYVFSLVIAVSTLRVCVSACVCVFVCVHMCTVNSQSCQIPLGGVWTDCVFHLVKVFRLQILRVGRSWNDLLKSGKRSPLWRLTISDVAVESDSRPPAPSLLSLFGSCVTWSFSLSHSRDTEGGGKKIYALVGFCFFCFCFAQVQRSYSKSRVRACEDAPSCCCSSVYLRSFKWLCIICVYTLFLTR